MVPTSQMLHVADEGVWKKKARDTKSMIFNHARKMTKWKRLQNFHIFTKVV